MRDLGELWRSFQADRGEGWTYERRVIINGVIYSEAEIYSFSKQNGLLFDDFTIGMCVSARFDMTIQKKQNVTIPRNAKVELQIRIVSDVVRLLDKDGIELYDSNGFALYATPFVSIPWITFGTYFIDNRTLEGNRLSLECYDAMLYADQTFLIDDELLDDYPMPAPQALKRILNAMGVFLDSRSVIRNDVMVDYPNRLTMREILGFIASAHGGNFCVTDENKLRLVIPQNSTSLFTVTRGDIKRATDSGGKRIDRLYMVFTDDGDFYEVGTGDTSLEVLNLFARQADTDRAYSIVSAYTYNAAEITSADIDPALELGDPITADGKQINLWSMRWSSRLYCDISAPTIGDTAREFDFKGTVSSAMSRRISLDSKYYGVSISRQYGLRIAREDGSSEMTMNSDTWEVVVAGGRVLYIDYTSDPPRFIFNGEFGADVVMAQDVIAQNFYAENGAVANLTVNALRTDYRRVLKYLDNDISPINYTFIHDESQQMLTAETDGTQTEQFTNLDGEALWWRDREIGGTITTQTTTPPEDSDEPYEPDVPVMVFVYRELVKFENSFTTMTLPGGQEAAAPVMVFGAGTGEGDNGKLSVWKEFATAHVRYVTNDGNATELRAENDGKWYYNDEELSTGLRVSGEYGTVAENARELRFTGNVEITEGPGSESIDIEIIDSGVAVSGEYGLVLDRVREFQFIGPGVSDISIEGESTAVISLEGAAVIGGSMGIQIDRMPTQADIDSFPDGAVIFIYNTAYPYVPEA